MVSSIMPSQEKVTIEEFNILELSSRNMFGATDGNWALSQRDHGAVTQRRNFLNNFDKQSTYTSHINTARYERASEIYDRGFDTTMS